jgi:hypothetical protein
LQISVVSISLLAVPTLADLHPAMLYGLMQVCFLIMK